MIKIEANEAKSIFEKILGLIGKKEPKGILIRTHFGIHTFGLKFPIDVLILDNDNKVVSLKKNLEPSRFFLWNPKYEKVLELPENTIENKKIKLGSAISLITH